MVINKSLKLNCYLRKSLDTKRLFRLIVVGKIFRDNNEMYNIIFLRMKKFIIDILLLIDFYQ